MLVQNFLLLPIFGIKLFASRQAIPEFHQHAGSEFDPATVFYFGLPVTY